MDIQEKIKRTYESEFLRSNLQFLANAFMFAFQRCDDLWKAEEFDVGKIDIVHKRANAKGSRFPRVLNCETQRLFFVVLERKAKFRHLFDARRRQNPRPFHAGAFHEHSENLTIEVC